MRKVGYSHCDSRRFYNQSRRLNLNRAGRSTLIKHGLYSLHFPSSPNEIGLLSRRESIKRSQVLLSSLRERSVPSSTVTRKTIMANGQRHSLVFCHRTRYTVDVDRNINADPRCEGKIMLSYEGLQSGSGRKMKFGIALLSPSAQLRTVRHMNPTRRPSLSASLIHIDTSLLIQGHIPTRPSSPHHSLLLPDLG